MTIEINACPKIPSATYRNLDGIRQSMFVDNDRIAKKRKSCFWIRDLTVLKLAAKAWEGHFSKMIK
jgi:hypothetical protein